MTDNEKFYAKMKQDLGESYKDIKLGGMKEIEKMNVLLFLWMWKKFYGTTEISKLSDWV